MKKTKLGTAVAMTCTALISIAGIGSANATVVNFNDFSSIAGLTLNGSATPAVTGDGAVLRLTPNNY